jgi:FAD/FMN-containing dehydrogenase
MASDAAIHQLRSVLEGPLLTPTDDGYDAARAVFNATIDRRPALIVRCANEADVVRALGFAREESLLVSVKCTGRNVAGFAVCDDGLVIDLSPMKSITVDPERQTVRAAAGCTWGEVNDALQPHALAAAGGFVSIDRLDSRPVRRDAAFPGRRRLRQLPGRRRRDRRPACGVRGEVRAAAALKGKFDPENVFRMNQNVRPAVSA